MKTIGITGASGAMGKKNLFPFFWPIDLGRAIFYGVRDKKNKLNYYIYNKQK